MNWHLPLLLICTPALGLVLHSSRRRKTEEVKEMDSTPNVDTSRFKTCGPMPFTSSEWETSYLWAVFIDGKDAAQGPHVYDWDRRFFYTMSSQLSSIYSTEGTFEGRAELSLSMVERFRTHTYQDKFYNEKCSVVTVDRFTGTKTETPVEPEDISSYKRKELHCKNKNGGNQIMPVCTDKMNCSDVNALLHNIPSYLYTARRGKAGADCPRGLHASIGNKARKREVLEKLIHKYNGEIRNLTQSGNATDDSLLESLATFTRSFAFLHAFENGNGRLRNILLQRELRRLGLACGTMMYNYNKDAFVDGHARYKAKVKEGIEMFKYGLQQKRNPWLDESIVEKHKAEFETLSGLEKCANRGKFGSGGTIGKK